VANRGIKLRDVYARLPKFFCRKFDCLPLLIGHVRGALSRLNVTARDLQFDLHEALVSGMTYNGVGLRLQRCQLGPQGLATCDVAVDNNSLTEEPGTDGSERASVVAVLSALDKNSILTTNSVYKFALKLPDQPAATSYTISPCVWPVPPNTQTIRVAIRDNSGRIGMIDLDTSHVKELIARHK
jgi:hypothetical protein